MVLCLPGEVYGLVEVAEVSQRSVRAVVGQAVNSSQLWAALPAEPLEASSDTSELSSLLCGEEALHVTSPGDLSRSHAFDEFALAHMEKDASRRARLEGELLALEGHRLADLKLLESTPTERVGDLRDVIVLAVQVPMKSST